MVLRFLVRAVSVWLIVSGSAVAQDPAADVASAVDRLGDFDHAVRIEASQLIRRADPEVAVPALIDALEDRHGMVGLAADQALREITGHRIEVPERPEGMEHAEYNRMRFGALQRGWTAWWAANRRDR